MLLLPFKQAIHCPEQKLSSKICVRKEGRMGAVNEGIAHAQACGFDPQFPALI